MLDLNSSTFCFQNIGIVLSLGDPNSAQLRRQQAKPNGRSDQLPSSLVIMLMHLNQYKIHQMSNGRPYIARTLLRRAENNLLEMACEPLLANAPRPLAFLLKYCTILYQLAG